MLTIKNCNLYNSFSFLLFQHWVFAYHIGKGLYNKTNNGLERMSYNFKRNYLNLRTNYTLSQLICIIIECFVPTFIKL